MLRFKFDKSLKCSVTTDESETNEMVLKVKDYFEWMLISGYSEFTVEGRNFDLSDFIRWCEERSIMKPIEVTKSILEGYRKYLYLHRKTNGDPLSLKCQFNRLVSIKGFFKWLSQNNHILYNPASDMELPKQGNRLPGQILRPHEVEEIMMVPDISTEIGLRDRALLELFYSTGIRRREAVMLKLYDLELREGLLYVREGKGRRDRVVPVGDRAVKWLDKYIIEARPMLAVEPDCKNVFIGKKGDPINLKYIGQIVSKYIKTAGVDKKGSCHLFRHSMATLMLEGGADIRYVQEMLGHAKLETTQIYTRVAISKLKDIHSKTHPASCNRSKLYE